ncbi:MAG: MoaD/ThiS family protein [Rhodocyclaceae bacterium]|nr:MoaD/ThiS family protein [Rhodocyclaceae bacterium]
MKVLIPSALRSYTEQQVWVEAAGDCLGEVLDDLDRQYPGIRFRMVDEQSRIRRHIRMFAGGEQLAGLDAPLTGTTELLVVQALSGG